MNRVPATAHRAAADLIDGPGTAEADWRAWPGLARLPEREVDGWSSAVVLAAHPDDEVLGAGGIIALLAAAGARIRVVSATDGEAAGVGGRLARRRARERFAALRALGAAEVEVVRLGLPDAGLTGRHAAVAQRLAGQVCGFDVCLAPWARDAHGDHEAVGRAAEQVDAPLLQYPVWMWHWARPGDPRVPWSDAVRVPLSPAVTDSKRAAIRCFASQLRPGPQKEPILAPGFVEHFTRDYEMLLAARP